MTFDLFYNVYGNIIDSVRYASFQVTSIITTTGFATANFDLFPSFSRVLLLILMFIGGCAGSTGGGIKNIRVLIILKYLYRELYQYIHPNAILSIKVGEDNIQEDILKDIKCDCAFPSATQNEIDGNDARTLVKCKVVSEGANMPTNLEGTKVFLEKGVLFGPGKAANAGGVAVSGLEMAQNSQHTRWTREEVDARLQEIMHAVHDQAYQAAEEYGFAWNYVVGANIAGFVKVADAMLDQGVV